MIRELKFSDLTPKQARIVSAMYFRCIIETKENMHRIPHKMIFLIYFKQKKPIAFSDYAIYGCESIYGCEYLRKEFTFVDKRYRNCGIAKTLMKYVTEKYSNYEIETIARNYLGNALENLGFKHIESRRCMSGYKMYLYIKAPKQ
jgi:GNAT superfamily N-acetyltransferase